MIPATNTHSTPNTPNTHNTANTPPNTTIRMMRSKDCTNYYDKTFPPALFEALQKHTILVFMEYWRAHKIDFTPLVNEITDCVARRGDGRGDGGEICVADTVEPMIDKYGLELFTQILSAIVDGKPCRDVNIHPRMRGWALVVNEIGRVASDGLHSSHVNSMAEYIMVRNALGKE